MNSGTLWLRAEWREGRLRVRDVAWASYWLGRYTLGFEGGLDTAMEAAARVYTDEREEDLERRVRAWFEREVRARLRPGGRAALDRHRADGDRLVLATSGSLYAARAAVEAYGLDDLVATTFVVADGRFTGKIDTLAIGKGKAVAVRTWAVKHGVDLTEATFYTDSMSDLSLLEAVRRPVVVNPDRALRKVAAQRGWPVEDWGLAT